MDLFIYFSEILGIPVLDSTGKKVGSLCDVAVGVSDEVYPKASALVIKKGYLQKEFASVDWGSVKEISDVLQLTIDSSKIIYTKERPKFDLSACLDILDQQVVDIDHQKVVRVNDIHLLRVDHHLHLAHVDVGTRALVRRLGWGKVIDFIVKLFFAQSRYLNQEDLIPWKNTQVLTLGRTKNVLRLDVARKKLSQIPPTELAEIMEDLDIFEKYSLFKSLDVNVQRKMFPDMATSEQEELIDQLEDKEVVDLIENIPSDDAADILMKLSKDKTLQLMRLMESKTSKLLRKLLGFAQDSAGGLMTTEYLYLQKDALVRDGIRKIKDNVHYAGSISHIYLIDEGHHLVGNTSLRRFINVDPDTSLLETCFPKTTSVRTDDGMEEIALLLEKYKFSSIPVVNEENVLQGVITIDDVMEELISTVWGKYKEKL